MTSIVLSLLALSFLPSAVLAECTGTTCETCLEGFNCVWSASGGACQEACADFPNVDCYYQRTFGEDSTTEQICAAAADKVEDNELCFQQATAEKCLATTGCDYIKGRIESGLERNWCALNVAYTPSAVPCSADTCNGCLADNSCVWMLHLDGAKCLNSCDNFPNIDCYYPKMFGVTTDQTAEICTAATNQTANNEACFSGGTDQKTCFGIDGCAWIATDTNDPENVGFCTLNLGTAPTSSAATTATSVLAWLWLGAAVLMI